MKTIIPLMEAERAELLKLPEGWIWTKLEEISTKITDGEHFRPKTQSHGVYFLSAKDVKEDGVSFDKPLYISEETSQKALKRCNPERGDILIVSRGATVGRMCIVKTDTIFCLLGSVILIKVNKNINSVFLNYVLKSPNINQKMISISGATAQQAIYLRDIKNIIVPLPPLLEQRAIVSKIELLFSELDNGISNLKLAQEQLKVYRQAVLKKAFEGELTKKWREQQIDLPNAEDLLEQIRKEREESSKTSGKKIKPVKSFTKEELEKLPRLPDRWFWVRFSEACDIKSNLVSPEEYKSCPHIAPDNIERETGRLLQYRTIEEDQVFSPKHLFFKGQIIYSKIRPYLNKLIIAPFDGLCSADMYPIESCMVTKYLFHFMLSKDFVNKASNSGSRTILPKINQVELGRISIPLCSLPEQQAIVQEIETRLSVCDKIEQDIKDNLERAEALRQSILKKAFEGKLLNERELEEARKAEDWESSEVLLERIRKEKVKK